MLSADESWKRRRRKYDRWLSEPGTIAFVAANDGELVGYTIAREVSGLDSWPTGDYILQVETMCIVPEARHVGIGPALATALREEAKRRGLAEVIAATLVTNDLAKTFFESERLSPFLVTYRGIL
jgi:ribosomal protein S18 acetylase RimI-like enzyme